MEKQVYKGRIVFRGDNVRDEEGNLAVFSEQGTSASHLEAAKMMDALARAFCDEGECHGEEADAIGAYTQAPLGGPETWITILKEYLPMMPYAFSAYLNYCPSEVKCIHCIDRNSKQKNLWHCYTVYSTVKKVLST